MQIDKPDGPRAHALVRELYVEPRAPLPPEPPPALLEADRVLSHDERAARRAPRVNPLLFLGAALLGGLLAYSVWRVARGRIAS